MIIQRMQLSFVIPIEVLMTQGYHEEGSSSAGYDCQMWMLKVTAMASCKQMYSCEEDYSS